MVEIRRTDHTDADFRRLVVELDEELHERDGEEHDFYAPFNKIDGLGLLGVALALVDNEAVGCGGFKRHDVNTAEIKRMFVAKPHRGQRIASRLLSELEAWAAEQGFTAAVLETGHNQPEAIALYTREGYELIPNYGQYSDVLNSVCMRKSI